MLSRVLFLSKSFANLDEILQLHKGKLKFFMYISPINLEIKDKRQKKMEIDKKD
jgi:hypothetical protein